MRVRDDERTQNTPFGKVSTAVVRALVNSPFLFFPTPNALSPSLAIFCVIVRHGRSFQFFSNAIILMNHSKFKQFLRLARDWTIFNFTLQ
jgi:hypothetical protein